MFMFCSDMNTPALPPFPNSPADERRRALLDRQLERLDQMIGAGMDMVQALAAQAAGAGPQVVEGDVILAYSRAARAVRMAILLQSHLIAEPDAGRDAVAERAAADADRVEPPAEDLAGRERDPDESTERPAREYAERLERDDIYRNVRTRPVGELVAEIGRDLGIDPDWPELSPEPDRHNDVADADAGAAFVAHRSQSPPQAASP